MEWIKGLSSGDDEWTPAEKAALDEAYAEGMQLATEFMKTLMEKGQRYADQGGYVAAVVVMFVAVHRATGMARHVLKQQKGGMDNPVVRAFHLFEAALATGSPEDGLAALAKWSRDHE